MPEPRKQMHQTTVRFDVELWQRIESEAARSGVSAAQYIRDATLIRLTRGVASGDPGETRAQRPPASAATGIDTRAVWAQARQARERARSLRDASHLLAEARALRPWAGNGWAQGGDAQR